MYNTYLNKLGDRCTETILNHQQNLITDGGFKLVKIVYERLRENLMKFRIQKSRTLQMRASKLKKHE